MVRIVFILLGLVILGKSFGQTKDLVFGNLSVQEISERIHFKAIQKSFLRFDNVGNGESFATIISTDSITKIDDYRFTECIVINDKIMNSLISMTKRSNSGVRQRPTETTGAFRIVLVNAEDSILFYSVNCRSSLEFFSHLNESIPKEESNMELVKLAQRITQFLKSLKQCQ